MSANPRLQYLAALGRLDSILYFGVYAAAGSRGGFFVVWGFRGKVVKPWRFAVGVGGARSSLLESPSAIRVLQSGRPNSGKALKGLFLNWA